MRPFSLVLHAARHDSIEKHFNSLGLKRSIGLVLFRGFSGNGLEFLFRRAIPFIPIPSDIRIGNLKTDLTVEIDSEFPEFQELRNRLVCLSKLGLCDSEIKT